MRTHTWTPALLSDAPHTTVDTTAHLRALVTQRANTHVCAHQQLTQDTRDFIHSFIQQCHSARAARARTVTRETHHTRCTSSHLFSNVVYADLSPLPPRLSASSSSAYSLRYVVGFQVRVFLCAYLS